MRVQDTSARAVAGANIFVYAPSGSVQGLYGQTDTSGQASFAIGTGTYTYGVNVEGMTAPPPSTITITGATASATITVSVPSLQISGRVLDGSSPVRGANMYAFNTARGTFLRSMTDANGNYAFYVEPNTVWQVGGWSSSLGKFDEQTETVTGTSLTDQNFIVATASVFTFTGAIHIGSTSGTGLAGVNIFASPTDGNAQNAAFAFSDNSGSYAISLRNGSYRLSAYHQQYGEIGSQSVTVSGTGGNVSDFVIATPRSVTVDFTGAGVPSDASHFEWFLSLSDTANRKGFSQHIVGATSYTFPSVPAGTYHLTIDAAGIGEVFSSGALTIAADTTVHVPLSAARALGIVSGTVVSSGSSTPVLDAYIELHDRTTDKTIWTKTATGGAWSLYVGSGTTFDLVVRKSGYLASTVFTGTTTATGYALSTPIPLTPVTQSITLSGTVTTSDSRVLDGQSIYLSLQGVNADGTDSSRWYGDYTAIGTGGTFSATVPADFGSGRLLLAAEGYTMFSDTVRVYTGANVSFDSGFTLVARSGGIAQPQSTPITPAQGGIVDDIASQIRLTLPASALGDSADAGSIVTRQTSAVPSVAGSLPIGGTAREIRATDSAGNPITNLTSDATIEVSYSGSDLVATKTGITLGEIKAMRVSYYDATTLSWVGLPTIVTVSGSDLLSTYSGGTYTGGTRLSGVPGYASMVFTLRANTSHFTLFTSLVSTAVNNSTATTDSPTVTPTPPSNTGGGGGGGGG